MTTPYENHIINSLTRAEHIMNGDTRAKEGVRLVLYIEFCFGKWIGSELI